MRPYKTFRLTEMPDVADIRAEARKSCVGRSDGKSYNRNTRAKKARRRALKRSDRARTQRFDLMFCF